jgi:hypothetical protein
MADPEIGELIEAGLELAWHLDNADQRRALRDAAAGLYVAYRPDNLSESSARFCRLYIHRKNP